jgi:acyl dehydratase
MRLATSKLDTAQLIADLEQNGLTDALVMSELLCEFEQARCMLVMVELARAGHAKPVLIGGKLRFELTEQAGAKLARIIADQILATLAAKVPS